ncbi:MAG: phosphopantetheine-binding protein, partial [Bacteroidota bacterium]
ERFMNDQNQQAQQLLQLLTQQLGESQEVAPKAQVPQKDYSGNIAPEILEAPKYTNGNGNGSSYGHGTSAQVATAPVAAPAAVETAGMDVAQLENILLEVVSEKTGYPAEMLELNMDMEADLGIDSIKRVEIFGALTQQYPEMSGINPNELTELRTLGEIVNYVSSTAGSSTATVSAQPSAVSSGEEHVNGTSAGGNLSTEQLEKILLEVVSEKTGYPAEMLELNMDMEADLGIDSIKRVEIFGALTQQYPEMSGINPNDLTELRTLGQIVDHVNAHGGKK